jgi:acyl-CoA thioesterase
VHLWAQDGTLLATASQSTIIRLMTDDMVAANRDRWNA